LELLTAHYEQAASYDGHAPRTPIPRLARLVLTASEGLTLVYLAQRDPAATQADQAELRSALQAMT
jgi:hypothetical protein